MALTARNLYTLTVTVLRSSLLKVSKSHNVPKMVVSPNRAKSTTHALSQKQKVNVTFIRASGERIDATGTEGDSLLDVVTNNDIDLDGFGTCWTINTKVFTWASINIIWLNGESKIEFLNSCKLEGKQYHGACEGTLTCSTCHLIFSKDVYDSLPTKPSDEEMDMLDLAYELTETSRLGCQIILTKKLDGLEVRVPSTINDARA